jgi:hypothetical protein
MEDDGAGGSGDRSVCVTGHGSERLRSDTSCLKKAVGTSQPRVSLATEGAEVSGAGGTADEADRERAVGGRTLCAEKRGDGAGVLTGPPLEPPAVNVRSELRMVAGPGPGPGPGPGQGVVLD